MAADRRSDRSDDPVMRVRERRDYNEAERLFSRILQERLQEVLQARRNRLEVLRRYPGEPHRLGIMQTPPGLPRERLRLPVVEEMVCQAIDFVRSDENGGPVSQAMAQDGSIYEMQSFPTKYPHIIIERTDHYLSDDSGPAEISWCLRRVQNQRQQTQYNRLLDAANIVFDLLRIIR